MTTYHERRKARYDNAIATYNAEWYDGYADERIGQLFKLIKFYIQQINKDDNCFGKIERSTIIHHRKNRRRIVQR